MRVVAGLMLAGSLALLAPGAASADPPKSSIVGTIQGTVVPVDPGNPSGPVTVYVQGQWNWTNNDTDCNTQSAGVGVAMIWNDPNEPGYPVTGNDNDGQTVFGVGIAQRLHGDALNDIDGMVHPADVGVEGGPNAPRPGLAAQVFHDPTAAAAQSPQDVKHWKGGCGREPLSAPPFAGHPYGSWGFSQSLNGARGYSHTYLHRSDVDSVCVSFYSVHGGGKVGSKDFQVPQNSNEIDVLKNDDNSIAAHHFRRAQGLNCVDFSSDLSITKTDGTATVTPGTATTYTIVVANSGPSTATSAAVSDVMPAGVSSDSWTAVASSGSSVAASSGNGNINTTVTLVAGGTATFTVAANISPSATGTLANTATVIPPTSVNDTHSANNTATDTDTLTPRADLSITKTDGTATVTPGTATTYTIVVANSGPSTATSAAVSDAMPAAVTSDTWTAVASSGSSVSTSTGSGSINTTVTLTPGGTATFTVIANVSPSASGTLANTATVVPTNVASDPSPSNNAATDTDTLTPRADLSITKSDGTTTVTPGTATTYTIVVGNSGPSTATSAAVSDAMPAAVASDSWTAAASNGSSVAAATGSGDINTTVTLLPGGTATFTVIANVSPSATGTLANTSTVTAPSGTTDSDSSNNSATDTDTLAPQADLSIAKTDGKSTAVPGGTTTYTVVVSNSGPSTAASAAVSDAMPTAVVSDTWTAAASSGSSVAAPAGSGNIDTTVTLLPGGTVTFTVIANVSPSATGTLTNTATVAAPSGTTDADPSNNSATDTDTLAPQADLSITKSDGTATLVPGTSTTYTVVVSNSGLSTAAGAAVSDAMPAAVLSDTWTAVASSGSTVAASSGSGDINTTVTLLPGGTATFTVIANVSPSATGTLVNTAAVAAPSSPSDTATDTDMLTPRVDLSITKTDGSATAAIGTSTTYTIVVSNSGPSTATSASVSDVMPAALSSDSWTASASSGSSVAASSGSGNINTAVTLLPGGTATFTVIANVSSSATGTLANTSTVTAASGTTDTDPSNNTATDTDTLTHGPAVLVVTTGTKDLNQAGVTAIQASGEFSVTVASTPAQVNTQFTASNLAKYRAVVFLDTDAGDLLDDGQRAAFESYFHAGGGYLGIGSAIETEPGWQFYTDILGTRSSGKTIVQSGTVKVFDRVHDATKDLPEYWDRTDAWYNFASNVRGVSHVLASVVEDPFGPQPQGQILDGIAGGTMGADHPVVWCKDYKGGRSFYTAGGNTPESFDDADFRTHLAGALGWAAGVADPVYSDCGATVLANYRQVKISGNPSLSEPIGFDRLPDGRIIQTDRRGGVHLHDPATGTSQVIANIPVYNNSEDGLYGPAVDNNFAADHWVYLYYAPQVVDHITYSDGTTGHTNDFRNAPFATGSAPTQAADLSDWDPWLGYFQLSRFKFVDDAPGVTAHLDLSSEEQILRVPNNRGTCCHVGGAIAFDAQDNLWFTTGDDSAAGSGDAGNWGQSIDQKTDENQTVRVINATGGTFTLTFNGQTTAPLAFNATAPQLQSALAALSTIGPGNIQVTGGPVNTANALVTWKGTFEEQDVPSLTSNATGLTGSPAPTITIGVGSGAGGSNTTARQGGLWRMPAADAARTSLNTNDLRGKLNRIHVKAGTIAPADFNELDLGTGGAYTVPAGNLFPLVAGVPQLKTKPEVYAMGFYNPFALEVDEDDVAYVSDHGPDSQTPQQFHGPAGAGRYVIIRHPANYGWPYCFGPDLPEYPWNVNLQVPMNVFDHQPATGTPQPYSCDGTTVPNNDYWNVNGGPGNEPGLTQTPGLTAPDIWYSFRDNNAAAPLGTPCFDYYGPNALTAPLASGSTTPCPRLFPDLYPSGVAPNGIAKYHYDPANPNPLKFPPYYDDSTILAEFDLDSMREVKLDAQNRVFKINSFLPCGQANTTSAFPFECDNPMDLQWGADGDFYLLTYGDGFFNINADAGLYRWEYVKGTRPPVAVAAADKSDGALPLTVTFSSTGSNTPEPGEAITFDWNFGDGTAHSSDPSPSHTFTTRGRYTVVLTVTSSSGKTATTSLVITAGNTSPTVVVTTPVSGGTFNFGDDIPYTITVTDPEDGAIVCTEVQVTFVLGHDTHGHAEGGTTGCSGVLHTDATDVSHGGNVFGVVSATYTDHGVGHDNVQTLSTTGQAQIRQKHEEVEFVVNQSGTTTATNNDGPPPGSPGVHRASLASGDWIELNGPYNLQNIDSITYRVSDTATRTAGTPMAAIEIHQDSPTGQIVQTHNLVSTGNATTWTSQNFPISLSGTHELFLVFRAVTGGQTGANLFNLNWIEFQGAGVGTP